MDRRFLYKSGVLIAFGVTFGGFAQAELHKFTSKDGSKSFEAELTHYVPNQKLVEVRRESGKVMKFKMAVLSEDDQKYVMKRAPVLKVAKDLKVSAKIQIGKKKVVKAKPTKRTTIPKSYRVTFRNTSNLKMEDLEVEYELHWVRDNGSGRKGEEKVVAKGSTLVSAVFPRQDLSFNTEAVNILYKEPFGGTG
ncbi:hypothetical protein OAF58_01415 [bacterium]|nr:hypothetical protein [bacterium]